MAIIIPPINPIRFEGSVDYEFSHNDELCYSQKFERTDSTKIQIRSDDLLEEEEVLTMTLHDASTGTLMDTVNFSVVPTILADQTFSIYEAEIVFNAYPEGDYYFLLGGLMSHVIQLRNTHKDTLFIKYRNSENNFNVVFDTDIIFGVRVEGTINSYTPKADDVIYNDQLRNATKLYGLPYNTFTLYVGSPKGVGDWMLDLINRAFSCDMIKVDEKWFEKTEEAEWEVIRSDNYPFAAMSLEIMPAQNRLLERLMIDEVNVDGGYMIIQRFSNNYVDNSTSIAIADTFVKNVVLDYITIFRKAAPYTLRVGTTPGGDELAEVAITDIVHSVSLNYKFNEDTTVYLSGFAGNSDVSVVWDRMDKFFNPGPSDPTPDPTGGLSRGAVVLWHGTPEDLEEQFNVVTGLGRTGQDWVGWAIMDGQNGTVDMSEAVAIGYGGGLTTLGASVGANARILTPSISQVSFGAKFINVASGSNTILYPVQPGDVRDETVESDNTGTGAPVDMRQLSKVLLYIKKIT